MSVGFDRVVRGFDIAGIIIKLFVANKDCFHGFAVSQVRGSRSQSCASSIFRSEDQ